MLSKIHAYKVFKHHLKRCGEITWLSIDGKYLFSNEEIHTQDFDVDEEEFLCAMAVDKDEACLSQEPIVLLKHGLMTEEILRENFKNVGTNMKK